MLIYLNVISLYLQILDVETADYRERSKMIPSPRDGGGGGLNSETCNCLLVLLDYYGHGFVTGYMLLVLTKM